MDEPHYPYEKPITEIRYDFKSISGEKEVKKRVFFTTSDYQTIYNLALVDVLEDGSISDMSESRNKDMNTILATVIRVIEHFFEANPINLIIFRGSDERRQRLYRLLIARELHKIQRKFQVYGVFNNEESEIFQPNVIYEYFVIVKN
ncbi:MAG: hypothetical protein MUE30_04960 [Spirosomaceae bacterium]|nr:hypothetical protein [Spirosomataceae bacterium]